jgi:hypothetical protein
MSATEIRETLMAVRHAAVVPTVDQVAFARRVRAERRRRTAARAAVATAVAASVAAVAGVSASVLSWDPAPPTSVAAAAVADPEQLVGFVVDGHLVVGGSAGYHVTSVPARNVLGVVDELLVLTDGTGALVGVPVAADGTPGPERRLLPGVVAYAWLDGGDGTVYVVDELGRLRSWRPGDERWTTQPSPQADLYLVDSGHQVESGPGGATLVADGLRRALPSGGGITGGGLAGSVLAWETTRQLRFYDADTGRRLARVPGQWSGALSTNGRSYAGSQDGRVSLVDTRDGAVTGVSGPAGLDGVVWTGDATFVGRERTADGATLWECRADTLSCTRLYADPSGTLQLHS